ncbi:hypothetical protein PLESTF_000544100 [Pleodorina starrii]|nr:hypothetical protein PLESTF_000544100 [Pleodorina starrii]
MRATDPSGRPLNDEDIWWDLHDVLGGMYSTSATIAVLLHCVSTSPGVQQRLQAEIDSVLGKCVVRTSPIGSSYSRPVGICALMRKY